MSAILHVLETILFMILLWFCMSFIILIHEFGHVFMYMVFFKKNDWHVTIGSAKPIKVFSKFTICVVPLSGLCSFDSNLVGSKFSKIMVYLGGAISNFLFMMVFLFVSPYIKGALSHVISPSAINFLLGVVFYTNLFCLITALLPMRYANGHISDAQLVLKVLKEKK